MSTQKCKTVSNNRLRTNIEEMIQTIEAMMSHIHVTLDDLGLLVNQIDNITERLERKYEQKHKDDHSKVCLDANRNPCEFITTPGAASKQTIPSPFLDYTYLDLTNRCDNYSGEIQNISYNEKYPLWIQYDTWRTDNTVSDASVVSSGSSSDGAQQSGSDGCSKSWKSASHCETSNSSRRRRRLNNNKDGITRDNSAVQFSKCCKTGNNVNDVDKYCGVYEYVMEQQLEHVDPVWAQCDEMHELGDSFSDEFNQDNLSQQSNYSLSMSDEHVIQFNKIRNTWTAFRMTDVTVTEISDSSSDVMD